MDDKNFEKLIVCFNCGHSEPQKNYSMRVIREDVLCPECGKVFVKKPLKGDLPGNLPEWVQKKNRFTKRLGAV